MSLLILIGRGLDLGERKSAKELRKVSVKRKRNGNRRELRSTKRTPNRKLNPEIVG